jgi:predicted hotdog family 3-hydroxylacyl-ACP dehydratase
VLPILQAQGSTASYNASMTSPVSLPLQQSEIRRLIPHAGKMCLLDRVVAFDATVIECEAQSHRDQDNPLRHGDCLPIHAGIEYCAQAIAVHGALTSGEHSAEPRRGYLAVVMNAEWHVDRLDNCSGPLQVVATKQVTLQQGVSYAFALKHEGHTLLAGQAVVALD